MPPISDKMKRWLGFGVAVVALALTVYGQAVESPGRWVGAVLGGLATLGGMFGVGMFGVGKVDDK